MESPKLQSPLSGSLTTLSQSSRSRGSGRLARIDDIHGQSLTSFNPFSDEDEHDQSPNNLVSSFLSMMKGISGPLSSAVGASSTTSKTTPATVPPPNQSGAQEPRRPSLSTIPSSPSLTAKRNPDRPQSLFTAPSSVAPPLVSLTPAQSEVTAFALDYDQQPQRQGRPYSPFETQEGMSFGTSIPGFPIPDDTRSIKTATTLHRSQSVSKVMRRIRGEGLSRDYWMDDENAKECYDCKSVFTTWRRKHHCRICGQIFCSRCASNGIKGGRFGLNGMIRVCNLCREKLATVDEDDDDDRRSVVSSVSFPAHQFGQFTPDGFPLGRHPQPPFAPAPIPFGRVDEHFNLFSISETKRSLHSYYGSDDGISRLILSDGNDGQWTDNPAPFRRPMSDEGDELDGLGNAFLQEDFPAGMTPDAGVEFPSRGLSVDVSSIQFPLGSPENDSPRPESRLRNPLYGDYEVATPFIRSRVHSRLDSIVAGEPGWRTRRESTAYANELNRASMAHLDAMLRQMLVLEKIPNINQWLDVLRPIALRIARETTFTTLPHRQGQDMDVRRYVKIKKIPGGMPKDSEYVNGVVITKNVAHKKMARSVYSPRIMLVTFPIEFHRVEGQYMHFGQMLRQEKEYLQNLTARMAALRPHVVLVEKSVSRLAIDLFAKFNIAVARSVKPSAIQTVARMTQGDIVSSMDKLALEPRLGHCARYRIQTFDHHLIPGQRKSYMRFEGCSRDMGCTIILRGGDLETLRRVKKVTRFLTFIVRNLKLETHLWKDSVISIGPDALKFPQLTPCSLGNNSIDRVGTPVGTPSSPGNSLATPTVESMARMPSTSSETNGSEKEGSIVDAVDEEEEQKRLTQRIDESLDPYNKIFISVSATLRFPPPHPIRRMKELDDELLAAKREWEDEIVRKEEQLQAKQQKEAAATPATASNVRELEQQQQQASEEQEDISAQIEALALPTPLSTTPPTTDGFFGPTTFLSPASVDSEGSSYFSNMPNSAPTVMSNFSLTPATPEPVQKETLKTEGDIQHQSKYTLIKWKHEEQRRVWEWYLRKNKDDFVVEKYQCISLREYIVPMTSSENGRPCFPPTIQYITFYGENDLTLGQFIEKSVNDAVSQFLDPKAICQGKSCDQPVARHGKVYVHNETRMFVAVEQWDGQIKARTGYYPSDLIITWSVCQQCKTETPFIPVSEEMQRYSFAKFLEAYFYPADVKLVQGAGCQHNIYQYHTRYFATKGVTVRFQTSKIDLHELVFPPFRIRVRPETQLDIKNSEFLQLHDRNNLWYDGLVHDLKQYAIEAATGDEKADTQLLVDINGLINKAEIERRDVTRLINTIYRDSPPTDTLVLNQVHAYRQDRIVAWQQDFDRLQKLRPAQPTQSDRSSKRVSAFGSVRGIWGRKYEPGGPFWDAHQYSGASEAEEGPIKSKPRRVTVGYIPPSSASETSETESMDEKSAAKAEESVPDSASTIGDRSTTALSETDDAASTTAPSESDETAPVTDATPSADSPAPVETPSTQPPVEEELPKDDHEHSEAGHDSDSDPDSDSTIGAARDEATGALKPRKKKKIPDLPAVEVPVSTLSRIPRRMSNQPSVTELIKKYSDYLPAQGVQELSKTAFPPRSTMSESEQEYPTILQRRTMRSRTKMAPVRKPSISDFEQSYAANVAPRYLQPRRPLNRGAGPSRNQESRTSSRRQSPEKRRPKEGLRTPDSPTPHKPPGGSRSSRLRAPSRGYTDKPGSRAPSVGPSTSRIPSRRGQPPPTSGGKVSSMARYYERLQKDTERPKGKYAVLRGKRARPVVNARAEVKVIRLEDIISDESDDSDPNDEVADDERDGDGDAEDELPFKPARKKQQTVDSTEETQPAPEIPKVETTAPPATDDAAAPDTTEHATQPPESQEIVSSKPASPLLPPTEPKRDAPVTPPVSDMEGPDKMPSFLKAVSTFLTQSHNFFELDDPFGDLEHIFRDSAMVVRLDEPTSIIALALNSPQYREMLAKSRAEKRTARVVDAKLMEGSEIFMPDDHSISDSTSTWGVVNVDAVDSIDPTEDLRMASSKLPWAITFESGGLSISCTILYPEQFDALRRTYDCEKSMVESLARCINWNASGGKSGSAFLKTQDDRFIAKELSRAELQTMETFAPAYFDYMSSAVSANRPTLLAKVFGCYKLTAKKISKERSSGKKSTQMNLLVMENLFYDRRFSRIYDLKGSTRNRHVQSTGQENQVLLDENLVQESHVNPFYLREHAKRIFRGALYNDSKFLADINVMDYSLVCGVDSKNHELVVGIVDYIRTYTWDKKVESWVKESTFLGGGGKGELPTIVTPKQYRQRFLGAMERYFPLVPDRWMKIPDQPEEDSSAVLSELWPDW
ncbi:1-phosphatidylinositol-3-phosphate 5-kinase [Coprinopsis cinerea okayama7|uniref:1-phosphatidylinositol-3-phosphate 5-kinase n=1 Tax=Coprinopsis cinerea (strain Okayama-7 / 130 / ATCC MYA-4618 / FGSC 9003) TaxID=240176 RepID=D6RK70_COPC7|nr:1-phosphatidylinositol-3-phosphate 5-kinase [Coprinopsis cinerea okayama7\|eukprot:XP_002912197.1 1-phosphatidylinositol-3-phosphate 5-kinase [Coprinopsis cinerea okayama7\